MKSDSTSCISHESKSPLHGILASTESLQESNFNVSKPEFVSTIQNYSGTLFDTVNHVLDYSEINPFQRPSAQQDTISNELYQVTNVALLFEDAINSMIAAKYYCGNVVQESGVNNFTLAVLHQGAGPVNQPKEVQAIVDINQYNWEDRIQPGAFRRVVMNIFGNVQKDTESGYILVQLRIFQDQKRVDFF
ncbi:hypothetical protein B0O99DRAFT_735766 [Bisporella sp. PMI_857]|nr:hypothetical protein B0O99DRAFT_735766 [Bisporella sp. PMI_857]